jgi:O-antigen/teichoic acid export membrane protein
MLVEDETKPEIRRPAPPLGEVSVRGAFWTFLGFAANKLIAIASQMALAWFLLPQDFGLLSFAFSVTSIVELVSSGGLIQVMVRRRDYSHRDSRDVFWLSLSLHVAATLVALALAPLAGVLFKNPRVTPLIMVIACSWPIGSLSAIYLIQLMRDLRFRSLAGIQIINGLIRAIGAVVLAALGCGAYSLVIPIYLCYATTALLLRRSVGPLAIRHPSADRWPALIKPTLWLSAQSLCEAIQEYGTYFIIGIVLSNDVVSGVYYWGFGLSGQTMFLLVNSLRGVFFPALARLNEEPERQHEAFRTALRMLTLVAIPVGILQALTADPLIRLIAPARWVFAIPVVQLLSIGMLTQPMEALGYSILMANGRFRALTFLGVWQVVTIVAAAAAGVATGTPTAIALWTSIALFVNGLLFGWVAERLFDNGWAALADSFRRILVPAIASGLVGWLAAFGLHRWLAPADSQSRPLTLLAELVGIATIAMSVYFALIVRFAREDTLDLLVRLKLHRLANLLARPAMQQT